MQLSSQDLGLAQDSDRAVKVVANLPYNVSVPVLIHLLEMERLESAMVMVQSEVARRLAAKPGSREYGVPSAKVAWFADATLSDSIPRAVFWPVPRVDSLLLKLQAHQPLSNEADRLLTFEIIDAAFNQRRKMLRSSLSRLLEEHVPELAVEVILERAGLDPTARAESISVEGFLAIARVIRSTHP
jgi:16S rRNA (adenine1518-N6/adenine1519-N6)-dimethyltransferase